MVPEHSNRTIFIIFAVSHSPLYKILGQNLRAARLHLNLTQEKAAEQIGISLKYWQALEGGFKAPTFATLCRIKNCLGCTWNEIGRGY